MMPEWLGNVYVIYTAAFVVFVGLAFFFLRAPVAQWLDAQAAAIRAELEEANRLRLEAEKLLVEYQQKQAVAEREAAAIVARARSEAEQLQQNAKQKVAAMLAQMQTQATERIARAESEAIAEIRDRVTAHATQLAATAIAAQLANQSEQEATQQAAIANLAAVKSA